MKIHLLKLALLPAALLFIFYACRKEQEAEKTYVVTYEINEGTGTPPSPQSYQTNGDPVKLNNGSSLSKTGFTFGGWAEKAGGPARSSPYTPTDHITLYAIWNPAIYTVAYNLRGGMGEAPMPQYYTYGGTPIALNDGEGLSKEGFAFGGWTDSSGDKSPVPTPYTATKSLTLYAIWNAASPCTITYNINGGTGETPVPQNYQYGGKPIALNTGIGLTKTGSAFGGWATTADGNTPVNNLRTPTESLTLYAIWLPAYVVSYNLNGGTGIPPPQQTYVQGREAISLSDGTGLTKTGFIFAGWAIAADSHTPIGSLYAPTEDVTLYAIWSSNAVTYFVSFNLNFAESGTPPAGQIYTVGGQALALPVNITRPGYAFGGWATTATGTAAAANPYTPEVNVILYAIWNPVYAVSYDLNGGTGNTPAPQIYTPGGTAITLNSGNGLTKEGFIFAGWAASAVGNPPLNSPYTPTANVTLYAIWNTVYTISYDLNGGTGNTLAPQTYTPGGTAITLNSGAGLSKQGFIFAGWADSAVGNTPAANPYTPTANVTLYAIWNPVYTVSYDLNGGSGNTPAPQTYTQGGTAIVLNSGAGLSKQGFIFAGWADSAVGNTPAPNPYTPTANVTLYAIWNTVYTISYDLNGGTGNTPAPQTYTQGGTAIALNNGAGLSKQGFIFAGWADSAVGNTPAASPYTPTANVTLYAIWNPVYTVSYDLNGGSGNTPTPQTYTQGGTAIALNSGAGLSKQGSAFGGWADSAVGNTPVASPYTPTANVTLYAIWSIVVTVSYDLNGGSGNTPTPQTYTQGGTAIALNSGNGLSKQGSAFGGWADSAVGNTPVASPYTPTANVTLYAIWNPVYTVSYDLNGGTGNTPPPQTYTQGRTANALNNGAGLSKQGSAFGGWAASATGNTPLNSPYTPTASVTLYAIWSTVVTYDINSGTGATPAPQTYNGVALILNSGRDISKPGVVFQGWATTQNGTASVDTPYTPASSLTLYAIWGPPVVFTLTAKTTSFTDNSTTDPMKLRHASRTSIGEVGENIS